MRHKSNYALAETRALLIRALRKAGVRTYQIARLLNIDHTLVTYYLSDDCKAFWRARGL